MSTDWLTGQPPVVAAGVEEVALEEGVVEGVVSWLSMFIGSHLCDSMLTAVS